MTTCPTKEIENMKPHWKQRIRKEFETPTRDLIQSFADDGYSKRLTAGAIGITVQTLLNYCRKENIQFPSRKDLREECKPKPRKLGIVRNPFGRRGKPDMSCSYTP
jgi:hypothetical protein